MGCGWTSYLDFPTADSPVVSVAIQRVVVDGQWVILAQKNELELILLRHWRLELGKGEVAMLEIEEAGNESEPNTLAVSRRYRSRVAQH